MDVQLKRAEFDLHCIWVMCKWVLMFSVIQMCLFTPEAGYIA